MTELQLGKTENQDTIHFRLRNFFKDLDFLVDVPAVVNPDFEQAVQGMTEADQVDPDDIIQVAHETQEGITPPPNGAGGKDGRRNDRSSGGQYRR